MNPDRTLILDAIRNGKLPVPFDSNPLARALKAQILEATEDGRLVIGYEPGEAFLQGANVVQGGAVAAMIDFPLGICPLPLLKDGATTATVSLNVSYLRPAVPGLLKATASVDRLGRGTAFTRGHIENEDGKVIATGSSILAVVPAA